MLEKKVCQYLEPLVPIVAANSWVAVLLLLLLDVLHTANTGGGRREEEEECVRKREAGRQAENESTHGGIYVDSIPGVWLKLPAHVPDNVFVEGIKQR